MKKIVVTGGSGKAGRAVLMAELFPGVPLREGTGEYDTLLSIAKARQVLGYDPAFSWREYV